MAIMTPTTGFKTISNGVSPTLSNGYVYTNIWDAKSQVIGILRFTTSLASALGLPSDAKWSDIDITKAILTLKIFKNNNKSSGYTIAVSGKTLTDSSSQTVATITNVSYYTTGNAFASGTAAQDQVVTFNLKNLFNNIPDGNSSSPTLYIYIWHGTYTAGSSTSDNYGFHKNASGSITATLDIEGHKKGGVGYFDGSDWQPCQIKYYVDSTTGWQDCEAQYWDGNDWIPVGAP